jgi:hypothetical protein
MRAASRGCGLGRGCKRLAYWLTLLLVDTTARLTAAIAAVAGAEVLVHENLREEVTARG